MDGGVTLIRAKIKKIHGKIDGDDSTVSRTPDKSQVPNYIEPTENGYAGLMAPVG